MTTRSVIGVLAKPPLPGRCLPKLLAAHAPEWVAGLYAAMLRDTLDGLLSIDASRYVVFAEAGDEVTSVLARHVPAPWEIFNGVTEATTALQQLAANDSVGLLARSDAPSAPIDPILDAIARGGDKPFALLGPAEAGSAWLVGGRGLDPILGKLPWGSPELAATIRVQCTRTVLPLHELPTANVVDEPSAVLALLEELRRHPERAPRTAHFVVTHG
ncbi:MAG: hypothetical protein K0S65_3345 [Labilithrix sp.]|nr:hypothetical protein [Labilithrix sp.]